MTDNWSDKGQTIEQFYCLSFFCSIFCPFSTLLSALFLFYCLSFFLFYCLPCFCSIVCPLSDLFLFYCLPCLTCQTIEQKQNRQWNRNRTENRTEIGQQKQFLLYCLSCLCSIVCLFSVLFSVHFLLYCLPCFCSIVCPSFCSIVCPVRNRTENRTEIGQQKQDRQ
jgi:uncharacterized membrane protein YesL